MENVEYYIIKERIHKNDRKKGFFYYELRHYDNNCKLFVIESGKVMVNFYGTLITNKEILKGKEYLDIKEFRATFNLSRNNKIYSKKLQ